MKPLTKEWIDKAEGDFATATRELRARKNPNYDAVCFHVQQCSEKYLKALLQEHDLEFGKSHHLAPLLDKAVTVNPFLETMRPALLTLNAFAVDFRYPGEAADRELAVRAVKLCRDIRARIRDALVISAS